MDNLSIGKIASNPAKGGENKKVDDSKHKEKALVDGSNIQKKNEETVVFTKSTEDKSPVGYDKTGHGYNKTEVDRLKASVDQKLMSLRETVKMLIEKQGYKFRDVLEFSENGEKIYDENGNEFLLEIDQETIAKAQEEISENGFWGVKQTSQRIIDFAKAISGDDISKLEQLKSAISEGFEAAKKAFGGKLPNISQKTYDAVMEGLDSWASEKA